VSFSKDGTLLATGCIDKNAYAWDIVAIIEEAGLKELLVSCSFHLSPPAKLAIQDVEKSFLHVCDMFRT